MKRSTFTVIVISCVVILVCCVCVVILAAVGIFTAAVSVESSSQSFPMPGVELGPTPVVIRPDVDFMPVQPDTLQTLETADVPVSDLIELAGRLEGKIDIPRTIEPPLTPFKVGDQQSFWVTNADTDENFSVETTLQYATDHLYFWIEDGVEYQQDHLRDLAETFENKIYPLNREFFGSEWTPGVDGDPHLFVIYAGGLGGNVAGYFSSADEVPPQAHEYSNAHETFIVNADNSGLDEDYTYGVLAHEYQHMIHWYQDRNESTWLNEGFAELAVFLNGYDTGGFDSLYINNPDLQLNDWPNDPNATAPHYGAAFLFVAYFLDRLGETATQALVGHPADGMASVDQVLTEINAIDALSGQKITADDLFLDWVLSNYLLDDGLGDGRLAYQNYPGAPQADDTERVHSCPSGLQTRDVHQYGVDYIRINCLGDFSLDFEGSVQVGVLPVDPYSGGYAFWSNKGDESDMTLTRTFDFSDQAGPLTLTYWTWYDLERDYDYVYLEVSADDGETWQILKTPSGTEEDITGNNFGWGYTGISGGDGSWILEKVDLTRFAGNQIQVRFEYVTDTAVHAEGFLLDDVAIPETGYFEDFEAGAGGWEAAGFVRIQNILPQTFRLALITIGEVTEVTYLSLEADNSIEIPLNGIGGEVDDVVLVVTGTTRFTRLKAAYQFEILP